MSGMWDRWFEGIVSAERIHKDQPPRPPASEVDMQSGVLQQQPLPYQSVGVAESAKRYLESRRPRPIQPLMVVSGFRTASLAARHLAKLDAAVGVAGARYEQVRRDGVWLLLVYLPDGSQVRVVSIDSQRPASRWGGLYDLCALCQIGISWRAAQRGGYA